MQSIQGKQVSVILPQALIQAIDDIADKQRTTRARIIRVLLVGGVLKDWSDQGMALQTEDEDLDWLVRKMLGTKA